MARDDKKQLTFPRLVRISYPRYGGAMIYFLLLAPELILNEHGAVMWMTRGWFELLDNLVQEGRAEVVE